MKQFNHSTVSAKKPNTFVRFLEESSAWKHYDFVWPLWLTHFWSQVHSVLVFLLGKRFKIFSWFQYFLTKFNRIDEWSWKLLLSKVAQIQCCKIKGQLISKGLFGILNSPKKRTKKFDLTTMIPQVELFSFVFWKNWRHQKYISKLTDL